MGAIGQAEREGKISRSPYKDRYDEEFDRGTIFGMRMDTALALSDFNGTYLGQYQGTIIDNTDDTAQIKIQIITVIDRYEENDSKASVDTMTIGK